MSVHEFFGIYQLRTSTGQVPVANEPWTHFTLFLTVILLLLLIIPWDYRNYRSKAKRKELFLVAIAIRVVLVGYFAIGCAASVPAVFVPS
jgi:uncharacterized membrane protein SirB2